MCTSGRLYPSCATDYLALSHCWGLRKFLTLSAENFCFFEAGVKDSDLVLNFRDAIHATRCLGFRYLWIDSLCIIQGSKEDWIREAPMMNQVYRNATITLAAAGSPDAYGGLFRTRNTALLVPHKTEFLLRQSNSEVLVTQKAYIQAGYHEWGVQVLSAKLNQRAWVLQERVLSRRTLYFGEDQIFWECRGLEASEIFPNGFSGRGKSRSGIKSTLGINPPDLEPRQAASNGPAEKRPDGNHVWMFPNGLPFFEEPPSEPRRAWHRIVNLYTACELTNTADRLIAISGLAKEFSIRLQDQYVAGMWLNSLLRELLWVCDAGCILEAPRRAPTWSWACREAQVSWYYEDRLNLVNPCLHILEVGVKPKSNDTMGEIVDAYIRASGYLLETPGHETQYDERGSAENWVFHSDDPVEPNTALDLRGLGLLFVPLGLYGWYLIGLVLRRQAKNNANFDSWPEIFERVGVLSIYGGRGITLNPAWTARDVRSYSAESLPRVEEQRGSSGAERSGSIKARELDWEWFDRSLGPVEIILK